MLGWLFVCPPLLSHWYRILVLSFHFPDNGFLRAVLGVAKELGSFPLAGGIFAERNESDSMIQECN
jgi:hypothetical protein